MKFLHKELRRVCSILFIALLLTPVVIHAAETSKEKIAFAYAAISPSMSGVWMAKEIGAFERNGLNAELVYISSGATAIQALVGGSVQAALGASNAVIAATLKGAPIIAVGSNTSRPGMQLLGSTGNPATGTTSRQNAGDHPLRFDERFRHAAGPAQAESRRQNRVASIWRSGGSRCGFSRAPGRRPRFIAGAGTASEDADRCR